MSKNNLQAPNLILAMYTKLIEKAWLKKTKMLALSARNQSHYQPDILTITEVYIISLAPVRPARISNGTIYNPGRFLFIPGHATESANMRRDDALLVHFSVW